MQPSDRSKFSSSESSHSSEEVVVQLTKRARTATGDSNGRRFTSPDPSSLSTSTISTISAPLFSARQAPHNQVAPKTLATTSTSRDETELTDSPAQDTFFRHFLSQPEARNHAPRQRRRLFSQANLSATTTSTTTTFDTSTVSTFATPLFAAALPSQEPAASRTLTGTTTALSESDSEQKGLETGDSFFHDLLSPPAVRRLPPPQRRRSIFSETKERPAITPSTAYTLQKFAIKKAKSSASPTSPSCDERESKRTVAAPEDTSLHALQSKPFASDDLISKRATLLFRNSNGSTAETSPTSTTRYGIPSQRAMPARSQPSASPLIWSKKSPDKKFNELFEEIITINGRDFRIEVLGMGTYHKVFKFLDDAEIVYGDTTIRTQDVVLKLLNSGNVGPNKIKEVIQDALRGYEHLKRHNIPVAAIHIDPVNFVDPLNPRNGLFYIIEKMEQPITGINWAYRGASARDAIPYEMLPEQDRQVLAWAKGIFNLMFATKQDVVNDFRRRNCMLDKTGTPVVVDYSPPETDKWDRQWGFFRYLVDWAHGNEQIFKYLIADLPPDEQNKLILKFTEEKA